MVDSVFELAMIFVSCKVHHAGSWIDVCSFPLTEHVEIVATSTANQRFLTNDVNARSELCTLKKGRKITELPRLSPHRIYQMIDHHAHVHRNIPNKTDVIRRSRRLGACCNFSPVQLFMPPRINWRTGHEILLRADLPAAYMTCYKPKV